MMDYIHIKFRGKSKDDSNDKEKSDEINRKNKSDSCESDIIKKEKEKILNKFLQEFLENKFKIKFSDKSGIKPEKYIKKFFEEDINI